MLRPLCLCAELPQLQLRTHLCLVMHSAELRKTTNTGRLAVRALRNAALLVHGRRQDLALEPDLSRYDT